MVEVLAVGLSGVGCKWLVSGSIINLTVRLCKGNHPCRGRPQCSLICRENKNVGLVRKERKADFSDSERLDFLEEGSRKFRVRKFGQDMANVTLNGAGGMEVGARVGCGV